MIDNGAVPNVLSLRIYERVSSEVKPDLTIDHVVYLTVSRRPLNAFGKACFLVQFSNQVMMVETLVSDLGDFEPLLGIQFFEQYRCIMIFDTKRMHSETFNFKLLM
jgi:hypothetical protein